MDLYGRDFPGALGITDPVLGRAVTDRVRAKLATRPVEALCIDFEDGYGPRSDEEEDREAERAAAELAFCEGTTVGIRIKAHPERGPRTLERFVRAAPIREGFTVTLPKVSRRADVHALSARLDRLELELGLPKIGVELMIETPLALMSDGRIATAELLDERVVAVHLGAYDLTAELGVTAVDQRLDHPFCDLARALLRLALASTDVRISDGATTLLPTPRKDASEEERAAAVHRAWALHARNVTRAIDVGIWQGWDLHPAQLPARYGALYAYFLARKEPLAERLRAFSEREQRATRVGQHFDDAATGRGLRAFFERGVACGAFDAEDVP
jgi:citrate lyase beta subunit